jgi:hypothetical protein
LDCRVTITYTFIFSLSIVYKSGHMVAQLLRHCATSRKVVGSIPDEVIGFLNLLNPSSRTLAQKSIQPITEMSTRNLPGYKGRPARKADSVIAICEPIKVKDKDIPLTSLEGP